MTGANINQNITNMTRRKYNYFHVATPIAAENFANYQDALKFYGFSEKPATLYGVTDHDGASGDEYVCIKSK